MPVAGPHDGPSPAARPAARPPARPAARPAARPVARPADRQVAWPAAWPVPGRTGSRSLFRAALAPVAARFKSLLRVAVVARLSAPAAAPTRLAAQLSSRLAARLFARAARGAAISLAWARRPDRAPALAGAALFALVFLLVGPEPAPEAPLSRALYAAGGELLGASVAADGQWRLEASSSPPERYVRALVAYEDRRFRGHAGFDPLAIIRAALDNLGAGRVVSGGSTLSMQTIRLSRPRGTRGIPTKLLELWAAVQLELRGDKAGIVALYSSLAPFGGNVVGLEAAGFRWFGRQAGTLTWAEAATLAVLPNSPGLVHPGRSREELGRKRDALLNRLAAGGAMTQSEYRAALAEALPGAARAMPDLAPHLLAKAGPGHSVTSLDYNLQALALEAAARHAALMDRHGIRNLAAIIIRVDDGSTAAYVGNAPRATSTGGGSGRTAPGSPSGSPLGSPSGSPSDFPLGTLPDDAAKRAAWVDCAIAPRSSGSILKPFLYAAMIDSGELSPSRLVPDIPTRVGSYSPENNLKTFAGAVRADEALARSLNVPFVRLLQAYGVERFDSLLRRLGFSSLVRAPADYGLTLILGGAETSLLDAARAYALLARLARAGAADSVGPGSDSTRPAAGAAGIAGHASSASSASSGSAAGPALFSAGAAWLTLEALVKVARPGDEASWQEYASSRLVAWKTGTSFGSRDAWAIGVNPDYVVAVWAGNADGEGRPELKGTDAAAPLLFTLFQFLPRGSWFARPDQSLRYETVCASSGYVAGPDCADTVQAAVPAGATSDTSCPYCRLVHLSDDGLWRVRAESAGALGLRTERRFVLPPVMEWYYSRSTVGYRPLPPLAPGMAGPEAGAVEFLAPEEGASLFVPIDLDGRPGKAVFRAAHRDRHARLFWHLDGDYLGQTHDDHRVEARPLPGFHELVVVDQDGSSASRRFMVYARE